MLVRCFDMAMGCGCAETKRRRTDGGGPRLPLDRNVELQDIHNGIAVDRGACTPSSYGSRCVPCSACWQGEFTDSVETRPGLRADNRIHRFCIHTARSLGPLRISGCCAIWRSYTGKLLHAERARERAETDATSSRPVPPSSVAARSSTSYRRSRLLKDQRPTSTHS